MKLVSFILSVYVLLLSVQPCCTEDNCTDEVTVAATEQAAAPREDVPKLPLEKECDTHCSPFYTCGSCAGFTPAIALYVMPSSIITTTHATFGYTTSLFSEVEHAIWQPPKIS